MSGYRSVTVKPERAPSATAMRRPGCGRTPRSPSIPTVPRTPHERHPPDLRPRLRRGSLPTLRPARGNADSEVRRLQALRWLWPGHGRRRIPAVPRVPPARATQWRRRRHGNRGGLAAVTPALRSSAEEAAACRAAWEGSTVKYAWHLHHEQLIEELTQPASARIAYILSQKPKKEQALRLRLFRPASQEAFKAMAPARAAYDKAVASARAAYDKAMAPAHEAECPDCPWDWTTIFGDAT